jgi:hypothetical protein
MGKKDGDGVPPSCPLEQPLAVDWVLGSIR